jgi:hypothetical protein
VVFWKVRVLEMFCVVVLLYSQENKCESCLLGRQDEVAEWLTKEKAHFACVALSSSVTVSKVKCPCFQLRRTCRLSEGKYVVAQERTTLQIVLLVKFKTSRRLPSRDLPHGATRIAARLIDTTHIEGMLGMLKSSAEVEQCAVPRR